MTLVLKRVLFLSLISAVVDLADYSIRKGGLWFHTDYASAVVAAAIFLTVYSISILDRVKPFGLGTALTSHVIAMLSVVAAGIIAAAAISLFVLFVDPDMPRVRALWSYRWSDPADSVGQTKGAYVVTEMSYHPFFVFLAASLTFGMMSAVSSIIIVVGQIVWRHRLTSR